MKKNDGDYPGNENIGDTINDPQKELEKEKQKNAALKNKLSGINASLNERNKELSGIYRITKLINDPKNSIEYVLEESAKILSKSYLDPENTCVRIIHNNKKYQTDNFSQSRLKQSISKQLDNSALHVEVYYLGEPSTSDRDPFLSEEHDLLNAISEELTVYLDRKNAEEATETNFQKFKSVFHSVQDAIFIHDLEGHFLEVNREACRRLNYSREKLLRLTPMDIDEKSYAAKAPRIFKKMDKEGRYKGETIHLSKEGTRIYTELNSTKILYEGQPAILTVARDITERKKHEKDLKQAKNKAEESARLKSAFLANLSHEIRTPLNAILGFSDLLEDENMERDKRKEFITTIKESGNKLLSLINDILDASFIESGQMKTDHQPFSLNALIDDLRNETKRQIHNDYKEDIELKVHKHFPDGEDYFISDSRKIHQIYGKLLDNAIKFTESGCIEFGYTFQEEGCIELFVKDTGTGIPEDSKSLIFERFRQLDTGLKRQYEGLGLGLSIVKGLVEQLDGKMEIKSTVNEGTTMIFKLSYQPGYLSSEKEEEEAISPKDLSGKKIVVAEDDMNNFLLIKEMLTDAHAEVMHADNGQKTIELCRNPDGINLILMDIRMPVMDGIEALSKIKDINPDIPLIALTAYAYEEDKKRLLEAGFDEYLSKPVSQKELIEVIEKFI